MTIRNRELSQFGSFIFIEDESQNIGIATTATPYVGIGTTNPTEKLHVYGNAKVEGDLEITGTFNFPIGELTFDQDTNDFNFYTSGIITASEFRNTSGLALTTFDSWDTSGSNIYRVSGNVGINSTIPTQKLDVGGNIQASQFISTVSGTRFSGTPPFQVESSFVVNNLNATFLQGGVPGGTSSEDIVTIEANQTLTNKRVGGDGIIFNGSTSGSTTLKATPTAGSGSVNLPTTSGTLICSGDTGTVTSGMIVNGTIIDADISGTAAIAYTKLNLNSSVTNSDLAGSIANNKLLNSTISGVSLGSNLADLTAGSFITYNSGSTYNGSTARTIAVNASTTGTSNIVSRDGTGSFSAGSITLSSNLTANGGTVSGNALSAAAGGLSVTGSAFINNSTSSTSTITGALRVGGGVGVVENAYIGGLLRNTNTTNSTSTSTGALVVSGGVGVGSSVHIGGDLIVNGSLTVAGGGLNQVLHLRHTEDRNVAGGALSAGSWQKRKLNTSVTNSVVNSSFDSVNFEFVLPSGSYDINVTVPGYSVNTHQSRIVSTVGNSITIYGTTEYANQPAGADKSQGFTRSTIRGVIDITTPTTFQIQHRVESSQTTNGGGLPTSFGTGGNLQPGNEIYTEVFIRKIA
jgi:hypothetical protein